MKKQTKTKLIFAFPLIYFLILVLIPILWFKDLRPDQFFYIHDQNPFLRTEAAKSVSAWDSRWLGTDGGMFVTAQSRALRFIFLDKLGLTIGQAEMVLFTVLFFLPGFSMYFFLKNLLGIAFDKKADELLIMLSSVIGSLLYACNLYLIILWHAGHYPTMGLVYALAPSVLSIMLNVYFKGESFMKNGLLMSLIFFVIGPAIPPNTIAMFIIIIPALFLSFLVFSFDKRAVINLTASLLVAFSFSMLFNLWWLAPYLKTLLFSSQNFINHESTDLSYVSLTGEPPGFLRRIMLYMKWTFDANWNGRNFHSFYPYYKTPIIKIVWAFLVIFLLSPYIYKEKKLNKKVVMVLSFSGLVLASSLLLSKGIKDPFSYIFVFLYKYVPFFKMFRSPGNKFGGPLLISMGTLLAVSVYLYLRKETDGKISGIKTLLIIPMVTLIIVLYSHPLLTGAAIKEKVEGGMPNNITSINSDYRNFSDFINSQSDSFRILFFPEGSNYGVFAPEKNLENGYEGSDMLQKLLDKPVIYSPNNTRTNIYNSQIIWQIYDSNNYNLLKFMNVKYLVYRDDFYSFDCENICKKLLEELPVKKVDGYKSFQVYEINDDVYLPRFYVADQVKILNDEQEFFKEVAENNISEINYAYITVNQNADKDLKINVGDGATSQIYFNKLTDSQYVIRLKTKADNAFVVFQEGFNKDWKLYKTNETQNDKILINMFINKEYLDEGSHYVTNSYANGWLINTQNLCNHKKCDVDKDGYYNFTFVADFWPNWIYKIGSLISIISVSLVVVGLSIYFIIHIWKKRA